MRQSYWKNNFNAIPIRFEKGLHRIQDFAFKAEFVNLISVFTFVSNICAKPECLKSYTRHLTSLLVHFEDTAKFPLYYLPTKQHYLIPKVICCGRMIEIVYYTMQLKCCNLKILSCEKNFTIIRVVLLG